MSSWISPYDYYVLYINVSLVIVLFTLFHTLVLKMDDPKNLVFIKTMGYVFLVSIVLFIGQRPINGVAFGDTVNYYVSYLNYAYGAGIEDNGDYGWHVFMKFMSGFVSIHTFFTVCAILYIVPLYKISKTFFKDYWYYAFLLFLVSFSFWPYGVNGVRNGVACSLLLWGVSYHRNKVIMALFFIIAITFHKAALLPILAFLVTYLYNNPKAYLTGWLVCIPLSLVMGGFWIGLFSNLGFGDEERIAGYLSVSHIAQTSFRWDFLFHSSFAVFAGWYFVIKRRFIDEMYFKLLNTYLICNGFWILVIRANFSNRFAYLSWFMMAIIIIYPLLKQRFFKNQHFMIGKIILVYFLFTYLMYYLYYDQHT